MVVARIPWSPSWFCLVGEQTERWLSGLLAVRAPTSPRFPRFSLDEAAHRLSLGIGDPPRAFGLDRATDLAIGTGFETITARTKATKGEPQVTLVLEQNVLDESANIELELFQGLGIPLLQKAHVDWPIFGGPKGGEVEQTAEHRFFGDLRDGPTVERGLPREAPLVARVLIQITARCLGLKRSHTVRGPTDIAVESATEIDSLQTGKGELETDLRCSPVPLLGSRVLGGIVEQEPGQSLRIAWRESIRNAGCDELVGHRDLGKGEGSSD